MVRATLLAYEIGRDDSGKQDYFKEAGDEDHGVELMEILGPLFYCCVFFG